MRSVATRPDISICIVNWNGQTLLGPLLRSIQAHSQGVAIQTIVVDNASADGSAKLISREYPWVELVKNDHNAGFSAANNQAAARAAGRYLLFLNNDTIIRPGAFAAMMEFMDGHGDFAAVAPRLIGVDGRPQQTVRNLPALGALLDQVLIVKWTRMFRRQYKAYRLRQFDPDRSAVVEQVAAAALMIRRDAYEQCGPWDEKYEFGVEDVDLCRRLGKCGKIQYLATADIDHLGRISSRANRGFVYRAYECGWARYLRKHEGTSAALRYKLLVTADLPLRVVLLAGAAMINRMRGRIEKARDYRDHFTAAGNFLLTGMLRFWRA
ncbi:MAG: glycosyltransferase [Phycisphaerales bacterium]|nr:glycosyltransferase [Phycisphaerales bacterium]